LDFLRFAFPVPFSAFSLVSSVNILDELVQDQLILQAEIVEEYQSIRGVFYVSENQSFTFAEF
jgi:hypothetical protein